MLFKIIPQSLDTKIEELKNKFTNLLYSRKYSEFLNAINQIQDKELAWSVIFNTMYQLLSVKQLINTAVSNIEEYKPALKELILYCWKNNVTSERFIENPYNQEILFLDDDKEIISMKASIGISPQDSTRYINGISTYTVLTGKNTGKVFYGNYDYRNQDNYRPIKLPE